MSSENVIIADAQELSVAGWKYLLQQAYGSDSAATVRDEPALTDRLGRSVSTLLIIDPYFLPEGPEGLGRLLANHQEIFALITVGSIKQEDLRPFIKKQEIGIVTKNCSQRELLGALEAARHREKFVCNRIVDTFMDYSDAKKMSDSDMLSLREVSIVNMIAQGFSTDEIGEKLHLSPHTVHSHRKNILKKLGVKTPVGLIVKALRAGLISV